MPLSAALKHSIEAVSIKSSKDLLSYIIKFAERDKTMITPLSDAIDARCCNRNVYDGKTVDRKTLTALAECGALMIPNGSPNYNYIADLVMQGNEALMDNSAARNEMMKWMRYNRKEADEQADGLAFDIIGAPPMPSAIAKPIIGFAMSSSSLNKADLKKIESSSHFAVFASSAAEVGFNLERFLLTASSMGVSCAFLNQPTESYVLAQSLKKRLSLNNEVGAILRIGYGAAPKRSRRRAVNTFIDPDVAQLQEMPVDVKFEI
jgi:hypothetical protein